jgi:hypothetical protein
LQRARAVLDAGFEKLVLEDPLYTPAWDELRLWLPRDSVAALRLFLPYPKYVRMGERSPFQISTASEDRQALLQQAEISLQVAADHGVPRILLPVASVPSPDAGGVLRAGDTKGETTAGHAFQKALDAYRTFVYRLLERAERYGRIVCLTPTHRDTELPHPAALDECLREFAGAPVGTWLEAHRLNRPLTGEIASVEGASIRHRPATEPEEGEMDPESLQNLLALGPIWCFDARKGASGAELAAGRELLEGLAPGQQTPSGEGIVPYE